MAAVLSIEQQVEKKKQDLLTHNPWLKLNTWSIHDYVFCICTKCTTEPLMKRNAMVAKWMLATIVLHISLSGKGTVPSPSLPIDALVKGLQHASDG